MKRIILCFFLFFICSWASVFSLDFGAVIGGNAEIVNAGETTTEAKTTLAPWLSLPMGSNADFFLSLGLSAEHIENWAFVPELFRLEFTIKPISSLFIRAGRIPWQDTSRFTAKGNFDGADAQLDLGKWKIGASVLYTGLLYQNNADINYSETDTTNYATDLDYTDFANTYFAPRRLLASVYADFPSLIAGRGDLSVGLLAQFDFSNAEEAYHTQYLLLRYIHVYKRFDMAAAAALELENTKENGVKAGYAFTLEGGWQAQVPLFIKDRVSLSVFFASGEGPGTAAFFPIVREAQGLALKPCFAGLMVIRANYEARILPVLSAELGFRYFIRTDSITFSDPYNDSYLKDDSYALGAEIDTALLWSPFSDLSFSVTGGLFLPQTGGAFKSGAPVIWSISVGALFSF